MIEICARKVAVFPTVVVISLLLGSFSSLADHRPDVGRTSWAKYEGFDGYMEIEEDEFDSDGRYQAWVFTSKFNSDGNGNHFCDEWMQEDSSRTHTRLLDENGSSGYSYQAQYFKPQWQCDEDGEFKAPFNRDLSGYAVDDYYECVIVVGYIELVDWNEQGGPGTYEWDTNVRLYVESSDHPSMGTQWKDACWVDDSGMHWIDILLRVGFIGSLLAVGFFVYRKRSAPIQVASVDTSAEGSHTNQQETNQSEDKSEEDDGPTLETEKEQGSLGGETASMFCPNCGLANEIEGKFCKDCGTNLSQ